MRTTRLLSTFNSITNVNVPFASLTSTYLAAKSLENKIPLLPRYFNKYDMKSTIETAKLTFDDTDFVWKLEGPLMKVYKTLLHPDFIPIALRLRREITQSDDEDETPTIDEDKYSNIIKEYPATIENYEEQCPITCYSFKEGDIIAETPCGHKFTATELKKYLLEFGNTCPMCRNQLD